MCSKCAEKDNDMTTLQKVAAILNILAVIVSVSAVIISYIAVRRSKKALEGTKEEALRIEDMWKD